MASESGQLARRVFIAGSMTALGTASVRPSLAAVPPKTVRIGLPQPFTGRFASYGKALAPGVELAAKIINEQGGVQSLGGAKLVIVRSDTKGDPKATLPAIERLIMDDEVSGIVGVFSSVDSTTSAPLADQYKIPFISATPLPAPASTATSSPR